MSVSNIKLKVTYLALCFWRIANSASEPHVCSTADTQRTVWSDVSSLRTTDEYTPDLEINPHG